MREPTDSLQDGIVKWHLFFEVALDDSHADRLCRTDDAVTGVGALGRVRVAALLLVEVNQDTLLLELSGGPEFLSEMINNKGEGDIPKELVTIPEKRWTWADLSQAFLNSARHPNCHDLALLLSTIADVYLWRKSVPNESIVKVRSNLHHIDRHRVEAT